MCRWKQRHSLSSPASSATAAESSVATALAALPGPASANTSEAAEASCFATVDVSTDPDESCEDNSGLQLLSAVAAELHVAATSTVSF